MCEMDHLHNNAHCYILPRQAFQCYNRTLCSEVKQYSHKLSNYGNSSVYCSSTSFESPIEFVLQKTENAHTQVFPRLSEIDISLAQEDGLG